MVRLSVFNDTMAMIRMPTSVVAHSQMILVRSFKLSSPFL
jgi:hypothetical protein